MGAQSTGWGAWLCALLVATPALARADTPPRAAGQTPAPTFDSHVEAVLIDVVVTDGEGLPVVGLTRDDFRVWDDGRLRGVTYFKERQAGSPASGSRSRSRALPLPIQTNQPERGQARPELLIVFDELHLAPEMARHAREALASFFESDLTSGAHVTLLSSGRAGRWWADLPEGRQDLRVFLASLGGRRPRDRSAARMGDYEAFVIHRGLDPMAESRALKRMFDLDVATNPCGITSPNSRACRTDEPIGAGTIRAKASATYAEASWRIDGVMRDLEELLRGLEGSRVRKSVVLVSEGFIQDQPPRPSYQAVRAAAARANAAVYFLDARLLDGSPWTHDPGIGTAADVRDQSDVMAESTFASMGTESLALDTGGLVLANVNDLSRGLERVMRESASYYLLGYPLDGEPTDGRYHKIAVEVSRPGVNVRARKGYYADPPRQEEEEASLEEVRLAALSPVVHTAIPLRAASYVSEPRPEGKVAVKLVIEADPRALAFGDGPETGSARLEAATVVFGRDGEIAFEQLRALEARLPESDQAGAGIRIVRGLELEPGVYQARFVLRDSTSAALGSIQHRLEVPPADGLRLLTPIVTDIVVRGGSDRVPQAVPVAHRLFAPTGSLACQVQVFVGPDGAGAPIHAAFEIAEDGGKVLAHSAPRALTPSGPGLLGQLIVVPMTQVPGGDYEIRIRLDAPAMGEVLLREPFVVEARS